MEAPTVTTLYRITNTAISPETRDLRRAATIRPSRNLRTPGLHLQPNRSLVVSWDVLAPWLKDLLLPEATGQADVRDHATSAKLSVACLLERVPVPAPSVVQAELAAEIEPAAQPVADALGSGPVEEVSPAAVPPMVTPAPEAPAVVTTPAPPALAPVPQDVGALIAMGHTELKRICTERGLPFRPNDSKLTLAKAILGVA